jgi:hypothetical protein|nr:hypothetical protein [uncultured Lachnoclostridium sp.]
MKIGQEIKITESRKLESICGGQILNVKEGDKALITKYGVKYLTGEARGKIVFDNEEKVISYDVENIAKRIAKNLVYDLGQYEFEDYLEEMDLTLKNLIDSILEELEEFI